ncbi:MAG TPA: superoxide dismutase [Flavobacteriales bacterium]|nr:superoxide dismutase [Flavobacteriales bacterium]
MEDQSRRKFIKNTAIVTGAVLVGCKTGASVINDDPPPPANYQGPVQFQQLPLGYEFNALEPHIDAKTMEIHFTKHHVAYITNLNKALVEQKVTSGQLEEIIKNISKYNTATRNNAGGHWNHAQFWKWMKPNGSGTYAGKAADAINAQFGSLDKFKESFTDAAMKRFGSGWAWLTQKDGKLEIVSTPNQDNPLMDVSDVKGKPLLGIDVWEHAYYLKYQNLRKDYITNWFNIVNWDEVASLM